MSTENKGFYYIAPADDPANAYAAGTDNRFEDEAEAALVAEELAKVPGFEGEWVVRWRDA